MRHLGILFTLTLLSGLPGCASTEPAEPAESERQAVAISKPLYDALNENAAAVLDPMTPWPDEYLLPSETYLECAAHAAAFADPDSYPLLEKALQICQRRHPQR